MAKIDPNYQMKFDKELRRQDELIRYTINLFEQEKFPKYIDNYKTYLGYMLDRLSSLEPWQTNINYPLVASIIDTMFANLFDFNYVFGVREPSFRELLNDTFDYKSQGKKMLKNCIKEALICGEAFSAVGFMKKEEEISILNGKMKETIVTKKPTIKYLSIFNTFYDSATSIEDSPFHISRIFNTGDYVYKKYSILFEGKNSTPLNIKAYIKRVLEAPDKNKLRFSNYDYNPVKRIKNLSHIITKAHNNKKPISTYIGSLTDELGNIDQNNLYLVTDKKQYEIVEYTCGNMLTVYVDGLLLYHGANLLDISYPTISGIIFNEIPGTGSGMGQVDNLSHIQEVLNGIWNGFLDNMKMQLSGMFAVYGNVPALTKDNKVRFEKFKGIKMTPDSRIERLELGLQDFSPLNLGQFMEGMAEKRAGVNSYLTGGQSKVERVSDSIQLIHNQYKSKLTPIIDSVQIMMARHAKAIMLIYLKYFSEEELKEKNIVIKKEGTRIKINDYFLSDILRDENISFAFNSLRNIEKENKRGIIKEMFTILMQTKQLAPQQIDELFKVLLDEDFDLDTFAGFNFNKYADIIIAQNLNNPAGLPTQPVENTEQVNEGEYIEQGNKNEEQQVSIEDMLMGMAK